MGRVGVSQGERRVREREHKVGTVSGSWVECELANEWGDGGVAEGRGSGTVWWESKPRELSLRDLFAI